MGIGKLESFLENHIEGFFNKKFSSDLEPVELSKALEKEIARQGKGKPRRKVPNQYVFFLAKEDYQRLCARRIMDELYAVAEKQVILQDYIMPGKLTVLCQADGEKQRGTFELKARFTEEEKPAEKTGDITILFTSDIHCGVKEGFGVVGLQQIRETLEKNGAETLLVDDGDAVQGDALGTITKGRAVITLMNDLHYDVVIPGNHEFGYGMDEFFELVDMAEFPYISCNFNKQGEFPFDPYVIKEAAGKKIAFIGVTTPESLTSTDPKAFMDEDGNVVYDFLQGENGDKFIEAIQKNIDEVRAQGVDYVILMAHLGNAEKDAPYNFQTVIERTSGLNAVFDGHTHDTDLVIMNDKDGNQVVRAAPGTKMQDIGYMRISGEDGSFECGQYIWSNETAAADLFGITNEMSEPLKKIFADLDETTKTVIAKTEVNLTIHDPKLKNSDGNPKRIVRMRETNFGDLAADAIRIQTGAEIGWINGGGVRKTINAGDVTFGDILEVFPFSNQLCVSELTGAQIRDALEWGVRQLPGENGGFLQVSGMSYEVDASIPSSCVVDTDGNFGGVNGKYRVHDIKVGDEPLDLNKTYHVACIDYILKSGGDGFVMFGPDNVVVDQIKIDNQALIDYIQGPLNGDVGKEYEDPYGDGRITITGLE